MNPNRWVQKSKYRKKKTTKHRNTNIMHLLERSTCQNILKNATRWKVSCNNYSDKVYANVHYDE